MNMNIGRKYADPPKYVPPLTEEQLHMRIARIIYMHPGGKSEADVAAESIITLLKREGVLR